MRENVASEIPGGADSRAGQTTGVPAILDKGNLAIRLDGADGRRGRCHCSGRLAVDWNRVRLVQIWDRTDRVAHEDDRRTWRDFDFETSVCFSESPTLLSPFYRLSLSSSCLPPSFDSMHGLTILAVSVLLAGTSARVSPRQGGQSLSSLVHSAHHPRPAPACIADASPPQATPPRM